jgi:hypothetical protein
VGTLIMGGWTEGFNSTGVVSFLTWAVGSLTFSVILYALLNVQNIL